MAVYTDVGAEDLEAFLADYDVGRLRSFKGIAEGVENSNFLVLTDRAPFILTLYEKRVEPADLPFFLGLMHHLAARGVPCPTPIRARDGESLRDLCGRPAAMVSFLSGVWPRRILPGQCAALGGALAGMHQAGADFSLRRPNNLSVAGWRLLFAGCEARADQVESGLRAELARDLADIAESWPVGLPSGVIHADLFPDNVFFDGETLTGLIDFYFACNDFLVYDLAVCLNAWCFERDLQFNATKARMLLNAYARVRPLSPAEVAAIPLLARGAAVRFLLTRLYDWLNQIEGALVTPKDPREYLAKLRFHRDVRSAAAYGLA
ncbi:MAG: homoserine kinase [Alphaproteobacteria bacterium]|nr:homoserine kinase [Alphaproteobacteria bacterium]